MTNKDQHQAQQQLNELLKNSHYLSSVLDSQRMALAQAIAIITRVITAQNATLTPLFLEAVSEIGAKTFISPSVDGDRALIARAMLEELTRPKVCKL